MRATTNPGADPKSLIPDARSPGHQAVDRSTAGRDVTVVGTIYQNYVSGSREVSWRVQVGVPPLVADSFVAPA